MDDESTNEIMMGAIAIFACSVILIVLVKYYPAIMAFFSSFAQNRHGQF